MFVEIVVIHRHFLRLWKKIDRGRRTFPTHLQLHLFVLNCKEEKYFVLRSIALHSNKHTVDQVHIFLRLPYKCHYWILQGVHL